MTKTLANGYSSESTQWELSNVYQHDRVSMFFKNNCIFVLWTKVASALEGIREYKHPVKAFPFIHSKVDLVKWTSLAIWWWSLEIIKCITTIMVLNSNFIYRISKLAINCLLFILTKMRYLLNLKATEIHGKSGVNIINFKEMRNPAFSFSSRIDGCLTPNYEYVFTLRLLMGCLPVELFN